jgi:hypothetical protein
MHTNDEFQVVTDWHITNEFGLGQSCDNSEQRVLKHRPRDLHYIAKQTAAEFSE